MKRLVLSLLFGLALILVSHSPLRADIIASFDWSGAPIVGADDLLFFPSGSAVFEVDGTYLRLTLTNTTTQEISAAWQALTGFIWDSDVELEPLTAVMPSGQLLVGPNAPSDGTEIGPQDLSGEWAFKDDIMAGGGLGFFGVGAIGDINFGADTFGAKDCFAPGGNEFCDSITGTVSPGGIDYAIIGPNFMPNGGFGGAGGSGGWSHGRANDL